jgi:class 3 adenylate cyclase
MQSVIETKRFVGTLFPANIRDRVMDDAFDDAGGAPFLKGAVDTEEIGGEDNEETGFGAYQTRPIADYFPHTTVMFADISGFTAWSSTREPFQVFQLLETLYGAFDDIAERRGVFKVETVGDSYVAVCGLPLPRKDHAVAMARFARSCTNKAHKITRKLEVLLGPDTADLAFRTGLHSGPVTGGVLRGKNARFQLFGDTMNTASRMESTGIRDRVQVSAKTAELLIAAGKSHWVTPRGETVTVKGKGQMETFWLTVKSDGNASEGTSSSTDESNYSSDDAELSDEGDGTTGDLQAILQAGHLTSKDRRLVDWNVAVLLHPLKAVVKQRNSVESAKSSSNFIEKEVVSQLKSYVTGIATMYQENPFHNFEHASHVTMSVTKLLSRVVTTDDAAVGGDGFTDNIASDALTQLAAVFSAMIHDVDHTGLSNARLVAEKAPVAIMYDNRSVAEKNSIAVAWEFLMRPEFSELRACIGELERFHHLVIDAVMATDIADKELKEERNARWATVFTESAQLPVENVTQLKASIVLDHMMQAADVSHTMQHWHIYRKWNERLFEESWKAYKAGRAETNPVDAWYKGELGFFDFYVIPLAKKLNECGVFGVSSDETLGYALENRREWELKGQEVLAMLVAKYCQDVPEEEKKVEGESGRATAVAKSA